MCWFAVLKFINFVNLLAHLVNVVRHAMTIKELNGSWFCCTIGRQFVFAAAADWAATWFAAPPVTPLLGDVEV